MEKLLKLCCLEKRLCAVYSDVDRTSKFMVCYIISTDSNFTIASLVDPYGNFDGFICFQTAMAFRIETDTKYLTALNKLTDCKKNVINLCMTKTFEEFIDSIKQERRICEIELCQSGQDDVNGYIAEIYENTIELNAIDEYGQDCGKTVLDKDMISAVSYQSHDTVKLEILSQYKDKK